MRMRSCWLLGLLNTSWKLSTYRLSSIIFWYPAPILSSLPQIKLVEVAPKLGKLNLLLLEDLFTFEEVSQKEELEEMEEQEKKLFKWNDFIDRVQANDDVLRFGLRAL